MSFKEVKRSISSFFHTGTGGKGGFNYAKELMVGLVLIVIITGAYFGYRWYRSTQEQVVQQLFAQNVEEFERVMQAGKKDDWASVETLFKLGYDQYPSSNLAPYFLVYQAQAMFKQDKFNDALATMDKAVHAMSNNAPLLGLYKTKTALMRLDAQDQAVRDAGVAQLKELTQDTKNNAYDVAAYYLGLYYIAHNEIAQAKAVWQTLVDTFKDVPKLGASPWAAKAQATLASI